MKISIIIPTHNRVTLVLDAVRSVLVQSFLPHEIIIVDDGSSDTTKRAVTSFIEDLSPGSPPVRYVYQPNAGPSAARNHGVRLATGDWIYFLDSDDTLKPNALELMAAQTTLTPAPAVIFARAHNVCEGKRTEYVNDPDLVNALNAAPDGPFYVPPTLTRGNVIPMGAVMVDRNAIIPFDESLKLAEDYDLWLSLAEKKNRFAYVNAVVLNRQIHSGNLIRQKIAMMEAEIEVLSRYTKFVAVAQRLPAIRYDLGSAYFKLKNWAKAREHLKQARGQGIKLAFKRLVAGVAA